MTDAPDSVGRFDGRSSDYARFRPSYPSGAIDVILEDLGDPRDIRAVDVGAGTGISLRLLVDRGVRAIGLEPNAGMREEASRLGLDVHGGTILAHDVPLGEATLVTAFQAFHWFADVPSANALRALLRPGGRIALVWNLFDRSDPFTNEFCDLLDHYADPHNIAGLGIDGTAIERALTHTGFEGRRVREVPYVQFLDEEALLGRLRSSSSAPREGAAYEAMAAALHAIVKRRARETGASEFPLVHRTHVVLAERPVPASRG